ncbi:MAG: hypothetical protein A2128_00595 [Candidatus Liptonbacteria bacterium GWC1_60_9]|uniref:Uncharacterized protein n=1 Tax=Candidatus Liptonbacteria bacterium GWC1_60_9 TaxID=1798645 RepID=A0A1G2C647_9BACT|nr:MAG: hypothetical protein A2128_00595 [Candidatus Liptonbacteria bacterium GWC1_60_9]
MRISFTCSVEALEQAVAKHCGIRADIGKDSSLSGGTSAQGAVGALISTLGFEDASEELLEARMVVADVSRDLSRVCISLETDPDDHDLKNESAEARREIKQWFLAQVKKLQKELGVTNG